MENIKLKITPFLYFKQEFEVKKKSEKNTQGIYDMSSIRPVS